MQEGPLRRGDQRKVLMKSRAMRVDEPDGATQQVGKRLRQADGPRQANHRGLAAGRPKNGAEQRLARGTSKIASKTTPSGCTLRLWRIAETAQNTFPTARCASFGVAGSSLGACSLSARSITAGMVTPYPPSRRGTPGSATRLADRRKRLPALFRTDPRG